MKYTVGTSSTIYPTVNYNVKGTEKTKHIFAGGQLLATISGSGASAVAHSVATDHLTGSNVVTSASGVVEELADYYPYGDIRLDEKSGTFSEQRKYAGQELDTDTGLSYMNARYYSGKTGRFVSQDPMALYSPEKLLGDPQSLNSYAYARNNPMRYVDPSGESFEWFDNGVIWVGNRVEQTASRHSSFNWALNHSIEIGLVSTLPLDLYMGAAAVAGSMGYYGLYRLGNTCLTGCGKVVELGIEESVGGSYILNSSRVLDKNNRVIYNGSVNLNKTIDAIDKGKLSPRLFPGTSDPKYYKNFEGHKELDYNNGNKYLEYNVLDSGAPSNNSERVLKGTVKGDLFYSPDHYQTLIEVK